MSHPLPSAVVLVGILLLFSALWCLSMWGTSFLTGWHRLGRRYGKRQEPSGATRSIGGLLLSIYMRYWTHYSGIVKITAADNALYLSINILFRCGHPPLEIPWSEIRIATRRVMLRNYVELLLGRNAPIPLRLTERQARKLGLLDETGNLVLPEAGKQISSAPIE